MANIRFLLNGCDISFIAEAPEDITLKELLAQTDKIRPDWCACGIRSLASDETYPTEVFITKDSVTLAKDTSATIDESGSWFKKKNK